MSPQSDTKNSAIWPSKQQCVPHFQTHSHFFSCYSLCPSPAFTIYQTLTSIQNPSKSCFLISTACLSHVNFSCSYSHIVSYTYFRAKSYFCLYNENTFAPLPTSTWEEGLHLICFFFFFSLSASSLVSYTQATFDTYLLN